MITDHRIYRYFHSHCPCCDSTNVTVTLAAPHRDTDGFITEDTNDVWCKCGWKGRVHDLLPRDKDLGPLKEGHVCKHHIRWPHECSLCEQQIYNIMTGKQPI